jgi:predicted transcriptional regulator
MASNDQHLKMNFTAKDVCKKAITVEPLSYDKMSNYFGELEGLGMICRHSGGLISITGKGREFTKQYRQLINLVEIVCRICRRKRIIAFILLLLPPETIVSNTATSFD